MKETAHRLFGIAARQRRNRLAHQRVTIRIGFARDPGEDFQLGDPTEERQNHRLHRHHGAVGGASVAPRLKVVRGGQGRAGECGRFVGRVAQPNHICNRSLQLSPVEIDRRVVNRVAPENHQRLDRTGFDRTGEVGKGSGGRCFDGHEINRLSDIAEQRVDRVGDGVDLRREMRAGDHERFTPVIDQILSAFIDPLLTDEGFESLREGLENVGAEGLTPDRCGQGQHVARREAQSVVGHAAGERKRTLRHIEAVHRVSRFRDATALCKFASVIQTAGLGVEKIGVEGEDAFSLGEAINGLHLGAENSLRGGDRRLVIDGLVFGPNGLRQRPAKFFENSRPSRRRRLVGQESKASALGRGVILANISQELVDGRSLQYRGALGVSRGPIRIVKIEDRSLGEQ